MEVEVATVMAQHLTWRLVETVVSASETKIP